MKMKEVLQQTGLTDRAVRLYIDSGLVAPSIAESYSGRKSIDFTGADVERLKNIALLRKVGFSIADIKGILQDSENARRIIDNFINEKQESIEHDTDVVSKLKGISSDDAVTLESLCEKLSSSAENKQVPQEDMKLSWVERLEKRGLDFWGTFNIVTALAALVGFLVAYKSQFVHLNASEFFDSFGIVLILGGWGIVLILSAVIILINRKKKNRSGNKELLQRFMYGFCALMVVPCWIGALFASLLGLIFGESYTTDINDYLVLDTWVEENYGEEIDLIFPDEIPASALDNDSVSYNPYYHPFTTRYYYFYDYTLDPCFDIAVQWTLPPDEYELVKKNAAELGSDSVQIQKGDWVCCYFADTQEFEDWNDETYWFLIFAYNDKTNTVRYIASHCVDSSPSGPYYLSMDW